MSQSHPLQTGPFLVTTNTRGGMPWLMEPGVREILINNLSMTRNLYHAQLYGFCILPDHMHIVLNPGERGISKFMHSFKCHSMVEIRKICFPSTSGTPWGSAMWQKGFDARILKNAQYLESALHYVANNGAHHGFAEHAEDWPGSSLQYPDLLDPTM